jgi:hypothetical protein
LERHSPLRLSPAPRTEENGKVVITRGGRFNFNDVRTALFGAKFPKARSLDELKSGLREHIRRKHARD